MIDPRDMNTNDRAFYDRGYSQALKDTSARIAELKAKLAKAVESLIRIDNLTCHNMPMTAREEQGVNREARATLAELEDKTDG